MNSWKLFFFCVISWIDLHAWCVKPRYDDPDQFFRSICSSISEEMFKKYCSMFDDPLESSPSTQMKTTYTKSKTLFKRQKQCVLLLLNESNVTIMHGVQTTNYSSECEWVLPLWCFSLENPIPVKTMYQLLNHIKMF